MAGLTTTAISVRAVTAAAFREEVIEPIAHEPHACSAVNLFEVLGGAVVAWTAIPAQWACLLAPFCGDVTDCGLATAQHPWSVRANAHAGDDDNATMTANNRSVIARRIQKTKVYMN